MVLLSQEKETIRGRPTFVKETYRMERKKKSKMKIEKLQLYVVILPTLQILWFEDRLPEQLRSDWRNRKVFASVDHIEAKSIIPIKKRTLSNINLISETLLKEYPVVVRSTNAVFYNLMQEEREELELPKMNVSDEVGLTNYLLEKTIFGIFIKANYQAFRDNLMVGTKLMEEAVLAGHFTILQGLLKPRHCFDQRGQPWPSPPHHGEQHAAGVGGQIIPQQVPQQLGQPHQLTADQITVHQHQDDQYHYFPMSPAVPPPPPNMSPVGAGGHVVKQMPQLSEHPVTDNNADVLRNMGMRE